MTMPSPFPGIDPFLEGPAYWSDFHATFINYWREAMPMRCQRTMKPDWRNGSI
jgi:hypothetical protein